MSNRNVRCPDFAFTRYDRFAVGRTRRYGPQSGGVFRVGRPASVASAPGNADPSWVPVAIEDASVWSGPRDRLERYLNWAFAAEYQCYSESRERTRLYNSTQNRQPKPAAKTHQPLFGDKPGRFPFPSSWFSAPHPLCADDGRHSISRRDVVECLPNSIDCRHGQCPQSLPDKLFVHGGELERQRHRRAL